MTKNNTICFREPARTCQCHQSHRGLWSPLSHTYASEGRRQVHAHYLQAFPKILSQCFLLARRDSKLSFRLFLIKRWCLYSWNMSISSSLSPAKVSTNITENSPVKHLVLNFQLSLGLSCFFNTRRQRNFKPKAIKISGGDAWAETHSPSGCLGFPLGLSGSSPHWFQNTMDWTSYCPDISPHQ